MKKYLPGVCCLTMMLFFFTLEAFAQPVEQSVKIMMAPDHEDWTYKTGEKVTFKVSILENGNLLKDVKIFYEVGLEQMDAIKKDSAILKNGMISIDGGTLKTPGFLRCVVTTKVDTKVYRNIATAAFSPLTISPTIENPKDFLQFWEGAKSEASKIPMDAKMVLLPERCTETVNVYHVSVQNFRVGSRLYGILCVPKKEGKYPAMLRVPGAGVRAYTGDVSWAQKGIITFEIGIHGVPVTMDPSVYSDLGNSALHEYVTFNLDNKDRYYYKRVYLGCLRANDFLVSLPQYDGKNLAVSGGSQGGALSIVTAALDQRVKFLSAYFPALSDLTGYLNGRAGGWPHLFNKNNVGANNTPEKKETVKYYDVVNFCRILRVPGFYSWGFNDEICAPTSMYAAYNVIKAPKELFLSLETGHWTYPNQRDKGDQWILKKLRAE